MECVDNNPVRAGAQLFSDGGQFLHAAKGSNPRCRFHDRLEFPELPSIAIASAIDS